MPNSLTPPIPFRDAFRFWVKLGFINFGGPAGQIAIMHRELVEKRHWISESRFLRALNYCMLLPGPEAQQLATYIGLLLHGTLGGIVAGMFFVLPSVFVLLLLAWVYAAYGHVQVVVHALEGFKPVVLAIVLEAVLRIGRRSLGSGFLVVVASSAFAGIYVWSVPFPAIILGAAVIGLAVQGVFPTFIRAKLMPAEQGAAELAAENAPSATAGRALRVLGLGLALWGVVFGAILILGGKSSLYAHMAIFFTKAALVTFGGAYAVLVYVAQAAVEQYRWLLPHEMIDGLALAESTPGPLIMVLQFVGFLGGWRVHGALSPLVSGTLAGLIATYFTFLPSFVFIFLGAPYVESWRSKRYLNAALATITAAVVGVIVNLGVFMATRVLVREGRPDLMAFLLMAAAFVLLVRFRLNVVWAVAGGGLVGLARGLMTI